MQVSALVNSVAVPGCNRDTVHEFVCVYSIVTLLVISIFLSDKHDKRYFQ